MDAVETKKRRVASLINAAVTATPPAPLVICAPAGYGKTSAVKLWSQTHGDPSRRMLWMRCAPGSASLLWDQLESLLADALEQTSEPTVLIIDEYHHASTAENDVALESLTVGREHLTLIVIARRVRVLDGALVASRVLSEHDLSYTPAEVHELREYVHAPSDDPSLHTAIERAAGWPLAVHVALGLTAQGSLPVASALNASVEGAPSDTDDPLGRLSRFALQHLELVSGLARRLLLTIAQLDAIKLDQAAEYLSASDADVRVALHELIEMGVVVRSGSTDPAGAAEFHCHSAVRAPLARRARRSPSQENWTALFRNRARSLERSDEFTAFALYCAAEAYGDAERVLSSGFTVITQREQACKRIIDRLSESTLLAHPTFTAVRILLSAADETVQSVRIDHLIGVWRAGLDQRLAAGKAEQSEEIWIALRVQLMVCSRLMGELAYADEIAWDLESHMLPPVFGVPAGGTAADYDGVTADRLTSPGWRLMDHHELGMTALMNGDPARARRHWGRLEECARALLTADAAGTRAGYQTDDAIGRRWLLAALGGLAFVDVLGGEMLRASRTLAEADELRHASGAEEPGLSWVNGEIARAFVGVEQGQESLLEDAATRVSPVLDRIEPWPLLLIAEAAFTMRQRGPHWALAQLRVGEAASRVSGRRTTGRWYDSLRAAQATLTTLSGDLAAAESSLATLDHTDMSVRIERARLSLYSSRDVSALLQAQSIGDASPSRRHRLDRHLIAGVAAWGCDRRDEAIASLARAAEILQEHGNVTALGAIPFDPLLELARAAREDGACDIVHLIEAAVPGPARTFRHEPLTPTELQALIAIASHGSANEAAGALFIAPATLKKHLASVYRKLRVKGRDEAILSAGRMGLLDSP